MGRKSTRENKTIYQQLREEDNLPREKASELLAFISEDRLERIENEKVQPAPEDVIRMSQVYNAWAAKETRFRVVDEVVKNIQRFQNGDATNRVY